MVQAGWRLTVDNYLGRVTKPRILEAVREAKGESSAQLIDHLKKADMAKEAERLLDGSGWLPEPLRLVDASPSSVEPEGEAGRCHNSSLARRSRRTAATSIRNSSTRLSDNIRAGSGCPAVAWGTGAQHRSHFYWEGLRGRVGPGRV